MNKIQRLAAVVLPTAYLAGAATVQAAEVPNAAEPAVATEPAPNPTTSASTSPSNAPATPSNVAAVPAVTASSANATAPTAYQEPSSIAVKEAPRNQEGPVTLFGSNPKIGGYAGISALYSRFADKDSGEFCLEGAVLIDRTLSIGAAGCGLSRTIRTTNLDAAANPNYRTGFGYGGALVRYHFANYKYFNFAVGALVGGGAITSGEMDGNDIDTDRTDHHPDFVFVAEPHVAAYLTMTRWLRLGATGGYRFVTGVERRGLSESDVAAPTFGLQLQAGWF